MKICDTEKLHKMVDEFCVENRPKSIDIHRMINECTVDKHFLQQKEYITNYDDDKNIENSIKLDLAIQVFETMLNELSDTISLKQFLEHIMYLYDLTEEQLLRD